MGSGRPRRGRWMMGKGICAMVRDIGFGGGWEVLMGRTWMLRGVGMQRGDE